MNRFNDMVKLYKDEEVRRENYQKGVWYYTENNDYPTKPNLCIRVVLYNEDEHIGYTEWYEPSEDEIGYGSLVLDVVSNGEVLLPEDIKMWCIIDKPPKEEA